MYSTRQRLPLHLWRCRGFEGQFQALSLSDLQGRCGRHERYWCTLLSEHGITHFTDPPNPRSFLRNRKWHYLFVWRGTTKWSFCYFQVWYKGQGCQVGYSNSYIDWKSCHYCRCYWIYLWRSIYHCVLNCYFFTYINSSGEAVLTAKCGDIICLPTTGLLIILTLSKSLILVAITPRYSPATIFLILQAFDSTSLLPSFVIFGGEVYGTFDLMNDTWVYNLPNMT